MTLREYFVKFRELLVQLDDRSLGVYVLHYMGDFSPGCRGFPPLEDISWVELHARLQPAPGREEEKAHGAPRLKSIQNLLAAVPTNFDRARDKERYESLVLATGQRARDLINGNPTALWNLTAERVRALEPMAERFEEIAQGAEFRARNARETADRTHRELAQARDELARLDTLHRSM